MTDFEILLLINARETALYAVTEFADVFRAELKDNGGRSYAEVENIVANVKPLVAFYIANAMSWKADRFGHVRYERTADDDRHPPSQVNGKLIRELEFLAEFMSKSPTKVRVRGRTSISLYAIRELEKAAVLGAGLVSHARSDDLAEHTGAGFTPLGLGGAYRMLPDEKSVSGFFEPGMITDHTASNVRLVDRLAARSANDRETSLFKVDPVRWILQPAVETALSEANRTRRGRHLCLRDVGRRIDNEGRNNLASCAKQAAELLKIAFHMSQPGDVDHSNKTIEQWLYAPPLSRFIVGVFELLAPTRNLDFDQIRFAQQIARTKGELTEEQTSDRLTKSAWDLACAGYDCAAAIVAAIPELHQIDLDAGVGVMEISEGEQRRGREHREALGNQQDAEDIQSRLTAGRDILIAKIWALRHDMLTLRGYAVFIDWYGAVLMERVPPRLFGEFLCQIFNEIQDWHRELEARYLEGVFYKRDLIRHAGGMPLAIPRLEPLVERHTPGIMEYPLGRGFGARLNRDVFASILGSLSMKHPDVRDIWQEVVKHVDPFSSQSA